MRSSSKVRYLEDWSLPLQVSWPTTKYQTIRRSGWQPIVDMALHILPGWQRGLVTRPGRLVLMNQVMIARATHHLMTAEARKWVLERIDKGC